METSTQSSPTVNPVVHVDSFAINTYVNTFLGLLGLIGNAFVSLVMLRNRKVFNSVTNKLIIHQSIVDFLASFLFILQQFLKISPGTVPDNILGSLYCKLWSSELLKYTVFVTSSYNLVAISIERYYATCKPVRHRNMFTTCRLKMIMATAWICGLISTGHILFSWFQSHSTCVPLWSSPVVQSVIICQSVATSLLIPLFIMTIAYVKIILELRRRSRARANDNNQDARNMLSRAEKNVTKTLLLVVIFFAICWTPGSVNYLLFNFGIFDPSSFSSVSAIFSTIVFVNLCINPFIYCFTYERFQKQVKKMVCGRQRNINQVGTTSGSTRQDTNAQHTVSATVSVIDATQHQAEPQDESAQ